MTLTVTGGGVSASASRTITHSPAGGSMWRDLGALTAEPRTMTAGDNVSVRTVTNNGGDAFWPTQPLVITSANVGPTAWPLALGQAINAQNGVVRVGVLNNSDQVVPQANATSNRVFTSAANIVSAFLQVQPPGVPPAPTNLNATPGNNQNVADLDASAGATAYNVKRSTVNGGPYTNVLVGVTGTAVTDIGLNNGTTYFYVVTAVNASGESPFSSQDDATPSGGRDRRRDGHGCGRGEQPVVQGAAGAAGEYHAHHLDDRDRQRGAHGRCGHPQQYNTVGGQITQSLPASAAPIPSSTAGR